MGGSTGHELERVIDHAEAKALVVRDVGRIGRLEVQACDPCLPRQALLHQQRTEPPSLRRGTDARNHQIPVTFGCVARFTLAQFRRRAVPRRIGGISSYARCHAAIEGHAPSVNRSLRHSMSMCPDDQAGDDLSRLRLRLVMDQANQYEAGGLSLADLAAGLDALISALRDESGDDESVVALQPIWVGIEIVNALCLDEGRGPTQNEDVEVRQDVARIRDVAAARLEQSA